VTSPDILLTEIALSDDRATRYEVGSGPWTADNESEAEFFFRPRPPDGATYLDVWIARLVRWPLTGSVAMSASPSRAPIEGPWEFRVTL
jgi:hypothetical protein